VPWARNLGFVEENQKRDILAGAAVLVQLSCNESLSLVALESWSQGVPVLASADCAVLADHLRRCRGGRAVENAAAFAAALDDLWQHPELWQRWGQLGRTYVRETYGCREGFLQRLLASIRDLTVPLAERMRRQGFLRAAEHARSTWREGFGRVVEDLLDSPPRQKRQQIDVRPRTSRRVVSAGSESILIPVRVANQGTLVAVPEGPGCLRLRSCVADERGQPCGLPAQATPLPGLLLPGQEMAAAMRVPVPTTPGRYQVTLSASKETKLVSGPQQQTSTPSPGCVLELIVESAERLTEDRCCDLSLQAVQQALVEAEGKQRLPTDYVDITQGFLAKWKRWLKRKLLGNFQHAYVDVLSRQQSAFNRQTLTALQELAECCAMLDHARATAKVGEGNTEKLTALLHHLADQIAQMQRRCADLEARLKELQEREAMRA
jgi:hypothetical protein